MTNGEFAPNSAWAAEVKRLARERDAVILAHNYQVGEIQEIPLMLGLPRVYTVLKLDNRVDREQGLGEKVEAVAPDR